MGNGNGKSLESWIWDAACSIRGAKDAPKYKEFILPLIFAKRLCDETPMPVLDPGRHRTRICQFWAHAMDDRPWGGPSPPAVAYVFADGRGAKEIAGQLTGFSGILQVDGYAAYKALARGHGGAIQLAFCLAHARRKFVEVYKTMQSPFAHEVIERLQAIYAIEAEIRGSSAERRLAVRRTRTAPLMTQLKARLTSMLDQLFSQSKLTEAVNYTFNHWDGLTRFLRDGRVEVDSNTVGRSMRPIAMGRPGPGGNARFEGRQVGNLKRVVDFQKQMGIYVLYDRFEQPVQVEQSNVIFTRLRQHRADHLRNRWAYFTWFGFFRVSVRENTLLVNNRTKELQRQIKLEAGLNEIEAVLIQVMEPRLNRRGSNWGDTEEYLQVREEDE